MENLTEKVHKPMSGFLILIIGLGLLVASPLLGLSGEIFGAIGAGFLGFFLLSGLFTIDPNQARVMLFFGSYVGTVKRNGFFWANPFYTKKPVSLRVRNLNGKTLKVNDKLGNPIEIAAVVVWQVEDTFRAVLGVDDYTSFVDLQSETSVRHLANMYPYDNHEDDSIHEAQTLRGGAGLVAQNLVTELNERLAMAGIQVLEARISHLAYSPEIAGAMLQRQQATAVVAARRQIVDGAVGMVEMALERLEVRGTLRMHEDRKSAMVANLLVVLCSEKAANPVVNATMS